MVQTSLFQAISQAARRAHGAQARALDFFERLAYYDMSLGA
jgi:hypothetical protein